MAAQDNIFRTLISIVGENRATPAFEAVSRDAQRLERDLRRVEGAMSDLVSGTIAAITGGAGIAMINQMVNKAEDFGEAVAQAERSVMNLGNRTSIEANKITESAERWGKALLTPATEIARAQELWIRMGITSEQQIDRLTPIVADFAAKAGATFSEASRLIGKASLEPAVAVSTLRRAGVTLLPIQQEMFANFEKFNLRGEAFNFMMEILAEKIGGASEVQRQWRGETMALNFWIDKLQRNLGKQLMPSVNASTGVMAKLVEVIADVSEPVQKAQAALFALGTAAATAGGIKGLGAVAGAAGVPGSWVRLVTGAGIAVTAITGVSMAFRALGKDAKERGENLNALVDKFREFSGIELPNLGQWLFNMEAGFSKLNFEDLTKSALSLLKTLGDVKDLLSGQMTSTKTDWVANLQVEIDKLSEDLKQIEKFFKGLMGQGPLVLPIKVDFQFPPILKDLFNLSPAGLLLDKFQKLPPAVHATSPLSQLIESFKATQERAKEPPAPAPTTTLGQIRDATSPFKMIEKLPLKEIREAISPYRTAVGIAGLNWGAGFGASTRTIPVPGFTDKVVPPSEPPWWLKYFQSQQDIPKRQHGGNIAPKGMAWVGEQGAELIRLPQGGSVMSAGSSRRYVQPFGGIDDALDRLTRNFDKLSDEIERLLKLFRDAFGSMNQDGRTGGLGGSQWTTTDVFRAMRGPSGPVFRTGTGPGSGAGWSTADVQDALGGYQGGFSNAGVRKAIEGAAGGGRMTTTQSQRPTPGTAVERIAMAKAAFADQLRKEGVPEANIEEASNLLAGQALAESQLNPRTVHDQGTGYGIYGARDPTPGKGRRTDMLSWMKREGYSPDSLEGQSRFMAHEAMSGQYPRTREALMGATLGTRASATATLVREFEKPADQGAGQINSRIRRVQEAAGVPAQQKAAVQNIPGGAPVAMGAGVVEMQQQVAAIRKGALNEQTRMQLEYAALQTGLRAEVTSGGQPSHGPHRTGSHRHDFGGAGDLQLRDPETGRLLDMRNPADQGRMKQFASAAARAGATGMGAGLGYMGPNTMHIGGGRETTWGGAAWMRDALKEGAASRLPPDAIRAAIDEGRARQSAARQNIPSTGDMAWAGTGGIDMDRVRGNYKDWRDNVASEIGDVMRERQAVELQGRGQIDVNLRGGAGQVESVRAADEGHLQLNLGRPTRFDIVRPGDPSIPGQM